MPTRLISKYAEVIGDFIEYGFMDWFVSGSGSGCLPDRSQTLLSASIMLPSFAKSSHAVTVWEMLINLLKWATVQCWSRRKVIRNPYPGPDHHQKLTNSSHW